MKPKIKIVYSKYYHDHITKEMKKIAEKSLQDKGFSFDSIGVPGSFEIPYEIARSIKQETLDKENNIGIFKGKNKDKMRDNILKLAKLSQLNLDQSCIYSGFLTLGCIIKGKTVNHEAISVSIFTNLQKISIENNIPIGNGIFNANNLKEAENKYFRCTEQALNVLFTFINDKKKK